MPKLVAVPSDIRATRIFRNTEAAVTELDAARAILALLIDNGEEDRFRLRHDLVCNALANIDACIERATASMKENHHE